MRFDERLKPMLLSCARAAAVAVPAHLFVWDLAVVLGYVEKAGPWSIAGRGALAWLLPLALLSAVFVLAWRDVPAVPPRRKVPETLSAAFGAVGAALVTALAVRELTLCRALLRSGAFAGKPVQAVLGFGVEVLAVGVGTALFVAPGAYEVYLKSAAVFGECFAFLSWAFAFAVGAGAFTVFFRTPYFLRYFTFGLRTPPSWAAAPAEGGKKRPERAPYEISLPAPSEEQAFAAAGSSEKEPEEEADDGPPPPELVDALDTTPPPSSLEVMGDPNAFDGLVGLDAVIEEIMAGIVIPYLDPEGAARYGIEAPKGVLMYGPPGTGKTSLAKAAARRLGWPMKAVSSADLLRPVVGGSERALREVFEWARRNAPAMVFIDEIDAIARRRDDLSLNRASDVLLNTLLVEMDGVKDLGEVCVMAATNRMDVLDEAVLRPGRFDLRIEVPLPGKGAREALFRRFLEGKPVDPELDFGLLASVTEGKSPADIEGMCKKAAVSAYKRRGKIGLEDFGLRKEGAGDAS